MTFVNGYPEWIGFFTLFNIIWFLSGFLAVGISVYYRWQYRGHSFTIGHAVLCVFLVLCGPFIFGGMVIYAMVEIINWDTPILKGYRYNDKYGKDYH